MKQYNYTEKTYPARPRNKRSRENNGAGGGMGTGGDGGFFSIPIDVAKPSSLWKPDKTTEYLTIDEEGTQAEIHTPVAVAGSVNSSADVVAYATGSMPEVLPIAGVDALGCIKVGENLTVSEDGTLNAKPTGSAANPHPLNISLNGVSQGDYDGSAAKNINITASGVGAAPASHTHGQYLTGIGLADWNSAATTTGEKLIGNSGNGSYVTVQEDLRVMKGAAFSSTPSVNGTSVALSSQLHNHNNLANLNTVNQPLSTTSKVQFNEVRSKTDVVAYSTGAAPAPFKYWRPAVSSSGVLSWSNSTSETTPASINIKGDNGTNGQGVTYQWSGTSLRLGTINPAGSTSWGSYVNLKGDKGDGGSSTWNGGTVNNQITAPSLYLGTTGNYWRFCANGNACVVSNNAQQLEDRGLNVYNNNNNTRTQIYGNTVNSMSPTSAGGRPRLWLNYYKSGGWSYQSEVYVGDGNGYQMCTINDNGNGKILIKNGTGTLSDGRLKHIFGRVDNVLDKIKDIHIYDYTRTDDEDKIMRTGVIAQEVAKSFPNIAVRNFTDEQAADQYYTVDYATLGAVVAIQGGKELLARIESLEERYRDLEEKLHQLEIKTKQS